MTATATDTPARVIGAPRVHVHNRRTDESLATLRERFDLAHSEAEAARAKLHARVMKALADGEPPAAVARTSGYTRQRVYQLIEEARSKG